MIFLLRIEKVLSFMKLSSFAERDMSVFWGTRAPFIQKFHQKSAVTRLS